MEFFQYLFSLEWGASDIRTIIVTLFCVFVAFLAKYFFPIGKERFFHFWEKWKTFNLSHKIISFAIIGTIIILWAYLDNDISPKTFSLLLAGLFFVFVFLILEKNEPSNNTTPPTQTTKEQ